MLNLVLLYLGAALPVLWGISHLFPTRSVASGFGDISVDNRRILVMEWIGEGVTLIFIGVLVAVVASRGQGDAVSKSVYTMSSVALLSLAIVSVFTGFRINFLPFRLCPFIFTGSAVLILAGGLL